MLSAVIGLDVYLYYCFFVTHFVVATQINSQSFSAIEAIEKNDYRKAFDIFHRIIYENNEIDTIFRAATGFKNYYNYLKAWDTMEYINNALKTFLNDPIIKRSLHVGNISFDSTGVEKNMQLDVMKSVAPWISELLSNYRVLFYNGQLDVIIGYPLTVNFLQNLKFNGSEEYKTAQRHLWHVDNQLAGYIKKAGNLTEVLVRNAGHLVPGDQPRWSFELISMFARNRIL